MPLSDTDPMFRPRLETTCRQRALIVDDCQLDRQILTRAIRTTGLDIDFVPAPTCAAARTLLASEPPFALAFVDRLLPDGCGLALTKAVAANNVPSILVSGDVHPALDEEARLAGCVSSISKEAVSGVTVTRALASGLQTQAAKLRAMPGDPVVAPHLHMLHQLVRDLRQCADERLGFEMRNMIDQLLAAIETSELPAALAVNPACRT